MSYNGSVVKTKIRDFYNALIAKVNSTLLFSDRSYLCTGSIYFCICCMMSLFLTAVEGDIMSKYIPGNHKHLTASDKLYIERALNVGTSFKEIARYLCKDPSTISKEILAHRLSDFYPGRGLFLNAKNFCIHRFHCQKKNVCGKLILCDIKCTSCPSCNQHCNNFVRERCNRLDRAPYVCKCHKYQPPIILSRIKKETYKNESTALYLAPILFLLYCRHL